MHVTEETAIVYRGATRRFLTRKAAYRDVAKREFLRCNDHLTQYCENDIAEIVAELMDSDDIERRNQDAIE